jgi:hypothetical protein
LVLTWERPRGPAGKVEEEEEEERNSNVNLSKVTVFSPSRPFTGNVDFGPGSLYHVDVDSVAKV